MGALVSRILVPAVMTFLAGGMFGFVVGQESAGAPQETLEPDLTAYYRTAVVAFALRPEQQRLLRILLHGYQTERRRIYDRQRVHLEPELAGLDARYEQTLDTRILDAKQRRVARELVEPVLVLPGASPDR